MSNRAIIFPKGEDRLEVSLGIMPLESEAKMGLKWACPEFVNAFTVVS